MTADTVTGSDVAPGVAADVAPDVAADVAPVTARQSVPWVSAGGLALAVAATDVFGAVSLQGAVGSIERAQGPFTLWIGITAVLAPMMLAVVLGTLRAVRRRVGPSLRSPRPVAVAVLALTLSTGLLGIGAAAINGAVDYRFQVSEIERLADLHAHRSVPGEAATSIGNDARCIGTCKARHDTLVAHLRGLGLLAPTLVAANLLVICWVVALAGGSLDAGPRRRRLGPA